MAGDRERYQRIPDLQLPGCPRSALRLRVARVRRPRNRSLRWKDNNSGGEIGDAGEAGGSPETHLRAREISRRRLTSGCTRSASAQGSRGICFSALCTAWTLHRERPRAVYIQYSFPLLIVVCLYKALHWNRIVVVCDCHTKSAETHGARPDEKGVLGDQGDQFSLRRHLSHSQRPSRPRHSAPCRIPFPTFGSGAGASSRCRFIACTRVLTPSTSRERRYLRWHLCSALTCRFCGREGRRLIS